MLKLFDFALIDPNDDRNARHKFAIDETVLVTLDRKAQTEDL